MCERDACGFCYGSLSVFFSFYKVYHKLFYVFETSAQKKKRFYVLISFFHIHDTHDRFSHPDRYALPPLRSDFLFVRHKSSTSPQFKALVIQPGSFYDDRLGTMFARVGAASLQLALPELLLKLAAVHVQLKPSAVFFSGSNEYTSFIR